MAARVVYLALNKLDKHKILIAVPATASNHVKCFTSYQYHGTGKKNHYPRNSLYNGRFYSSKADSNEMPELLKEYRPVETLVSKQKDQSELGERGEKPPYETRKEIVEPRRPFMKSIFIGEYDKSVLIYPEMELEEVQELEEMIKPIEKYFTEKLDSKSIDINAKIPDDVLQQIKDLGLYGQQIPEQYGGLGLNATQYARIAEITSLDGAVAVTLAAHQAIGLKGILIAGNEEQKQKYLPKLATGEMTAAFCLTEPSSGSDAASINTRATLSEDGKTWFLDGGKIWISNGGIADFFTVFAKTEFINEKGEKEDKVTAFLVERDFGGVSHGQPEDKMGIRGSNTCSVNFDNTPIPAENVLGEVGQGFKIAMNILNSGRFSMGSSGAGMLKRLIGWTMEHAATRKQFNKNLIEFGMIQEKFAHMSMVTYAMESMAYLTAGLLDSGLYDDCSVEAAIVKVYSSEGCWSQVSECLQILGGLGYMRNYPYERYVRDSRIMMIFEGTNEVLRLFIALNGLKYAGDHYKHVIKDLGNFFQNPRLAIRHSRAYIGKLAKQQMKLISPTFMRLKAKQKSVHSIEEEVHPQLAKSAKMLSDTVQDFSVVTEKLLYKFKADVINEQMLLSRLADASIYIFAMTAVMSRASRSKCIGFRGCDHEVLLANTFVYDHHLKCLDIFKDLEYATLGDTRHKTYARIAKEVSENMGYVPAHPLTKMF